MKRALNLFLIVSLFGFSVFPLQAQQAISASGGDAKGNGGSVSYTVGQVFYRTLQGTDGSAALGVQQPYEISIVTAIENSEDINLEYKVYPNPTGGLINLTIKPFDHKKMKYQLYDQNGILLLDKKIESENTEISLIRFYSSTYFLRIIENNIEVKVFKIIKR